MQRQHSFNNEQLKRLQEVFDELDTDGSDDLDYDELKKALGAYGVDLSLKELKEIWVKADKDASSGISFDEFVEAVSKLEDKKLKSRIRDSTADGEDESSNCSVM